METAPTDLEVLWPVREVGEVEGKSVRLCQWIQVDRVELEQVRACERAQGRHVGVVLLLCGVATGCYVVAMGWLICVMMLPYVI